MKHLWLLVPIILLGSCKSDDDSPVIQNPDTPGLAYALSDSDFATTYSKLRNSLQTNANITVVAEINHTANAQAIGQELRSTRLILFGNPALETPIMQANQVAGLDIPQKMLVYQNNEGNVFAAYNTTAYISERHNVGTVGTMQQLSNTLANAAHDATNGTVSENSSSLVTQGEGIITVVSNNDFATTYNNLRNAVSDNLDLAIVAEVNHQANAQAEGLSLDPTRLIIFGNTSLGTSLMQASNTVGLDLPQKMLVWEETDGTVNITYTNPDYLKSRYAIPGNENIIAQMKSTLANLAIDAAN
jgi:uncharacterized protein (DUF302 family)